MDTPHVHGTFDPRVFRRALGNFATGVTVITAHDGERAVGVTANSFNSVSLDPPLILWSIDKRSGSYPVFAHATHFAVNVLAVDQISLSDRFATGRDDKFSGVPYRSGHGGCLLLEDTSASFQCKKVQVIDGGDHWILIGQVVSFEDNGRSPLLYHQGTYSMALPHPHRARRESSAPAPDSFQRRLADHPYHLMTQAVRNYQQLFQPEQLKTGWRSGEARVLMILQAGPCGDLAVLAREADMPRSEVEQTLELLCGGGLAEQTAAGYQLTAAGAAQANDIWDMAKRHEDRLLAPFDAEQVRAFKNVLKSIIAAT